MKFEDIKIVEKVVTTKEIDVKTFLCETFGLGREPCKLSDLVNGCNNCPCIGFDGCIMKFIYHKLD